MNIDSILGNLARAPCGRGAGSDVCPQCWKRSSALHKCPAYQELTFWWEEGEKTEEYTKFTLETQGLQRKIKKSREGAGQVLVSS